MRSQLYNDRNAATGTSQRFPGLPRYALSWTRFCEGDNRNRRRGEKRQADIGKLSP